MTAEWIHACPVIDALDRDVFGLLSRASLACGEAGDSVSYVVGGYIREMVRYFHVDYEQEIQ